MTVIGQSLKLKNMTLMWDCNETVTVHKIEHYEPKVPVRLRPEGGVNGTFVVFAYLIIATGDEQKEKNRIKI